MNENQEYYTTNNVAGIIKIIAIISCIIGIIACVIASKYLEIYTIVGIVVSIISSVFIYALAELIEIMHDIRTNTEHLRDYFEREKK